MQITPAALRAINVGFDRRFQQAYSAASPVLQGRLATVVPSTTHSNVYGWMLKLPRLREWVSERVIENLASKSYTIVNKDYELTVGVNRNDIEDDQLGIYNPTVEMMGEQAQLWGDDRIYELLAANSESFDGQPFFHSDHPTSTPSGDITQSNNFTSSALSATTYQTVREAMRKFKGEDGQALGVRPDVLIVPPALEYTALEITQAERNAAGATNILRGTADVIVADNLPDDTTWYLADTRRPMKPFVVQTRRNPQVVMMTDPTDEAVFSSKQFRYGVDARGNAGYGLWFLMARASA